MTVYKTIPLLRFYFHTKATQIDLTGIPTLCEVRLELDTASEVIVTLDTTVLSCESQGYLKPDPRATEVTRNKARTCIECSTIK